MLELDFDIEPDTDGVIDGRVLAHSLIQTAYALLAPYVDRCPACSDALFSAVANVAIEELHSGDEGLPCRVMSVKTDADDTRWRKHAAETRGFTEALLSAAAPHVH